MKPRGKCIDWNGRINTGGYGVLCVRGKQVMAHRAEWEKLHGKIPEGLCVDHLCRNRRCVNPRHMELVTSHENIMRGVSPAAMNARKTHCVRGHPYDLGNLHMRTNGYRVCRACNRDRNSRRRKSESSIKKELIAALAAFVDDECHCPESEGECVQCVARAALKAAGYKGRSE